MATQLVYFVLQKEFLKFSETAPWLYGFGILKMLYKCTKLLKSKKLFLYTVYLSSYTLNVIYFVNHYMK